MAQNLVGHDGVNAVGRWAPQGSLTHWATTVWMNW